jgi:hypothetical protein
MRNRLSVAVLCALLAGGALLGTPPSCGRNASAQGPVCCRNAATCPMHQTAASGLLGFNACHGDGGTASTALTVHRAVLRSELSTMVIPQHDRTFGSTVPFLPSVSRVPVTPPPRLG